MGVEVEEGRGEGLVSILNWRILPTTYFWGPGLSWKGKRGDITQFNPFRTCRILGQYICRLVAMISDLRVCLPGVSSWDIPPPPPFAASIK